MLTFLLWTLGFTVFAWALGRTLRRRNSRPNSNDDDGGTPVEPALPVYDPPSGHSLDDLLTDRPPPRLGQPSRRPVLN